MNRTSVRRGYCRISEYAALNRASFRFVNTLFPRRCLADFFIYLLCLLCVIYHCRSEPNAHGIAVNYAPLLYKSVNQTFFPLYPEDGLLADMVAI